MLRAQSLLLQSWRGMNIIETKSFIKRFALSCQMSSPLASDNNSTDEKDIYGPPSSNSLRILADDTDIDGEHIDNYDMWDSVDDEYTLSEKMVHYLVGRCVLQEHWIACKATLVFHAGSVTNKLAPTTKVSREHATFNAYNDASAALDISHFNPNGIPYFRRGNNSMTGIKVMRSLILPLFPVYFNIMKSGEGFQKSVNLALTKMYRNALTTRSKDRMAKEEADNKLPPTFWEYKKKPMYFALAVKVFVEICTWHRTSTTLLMIPQNKPVGRTELKRMGHYKSHSCNSDLAVEVIDIYADKEKEKKKKRKEASVATSVMNTNLTIRMGQMQELKESMNVLDRMRSIIGNGEYATRAISLMSCLPDPDTYTTEVTSSKELVTTSKPSSTEDKEKEDEEDEL
jgi:hypothetical protein